MIVCHCRSITDQTIRQAVRRGARTRNQVIEACDANTCCGGCGPAIDEIIDSEAQRDAATARSPYRELAVAS